MASKKRTTSKTQKPEAPKDESAVTAKPEPAKAAQETPQEPEKAAAPAAPSVPEPPADPAPEPPAPAPEPVNDPGGPDQPAPDDPKGPEDKRAWPEMPNVALRMLQMIRQHPQGVDAPTVIVTCGVMMAPGFQMINELKARRFARLVSGRAANLLFLTVEGAKELSAQEEQ